MHLESAHPAFLTTIVVLVQEGLKEWNFPFSRGGGISDGHFIIPFFLLQVV